LGIDFTGKWRPLPDSVTIKDSNIEGLGLFAKTKISANTNLGIMRILLDGEWIRTALGSFSNHVNNNPSCKNIEDVNEKGYKYFYLETIKDIEPGEELTLSYKMPEYYEEK
jgi:SET domain-containing protein